MVSFWVLYTCFLNIFPKTTNFAHTFCLFCVFLKPLGSIEANNNLKFLNSLTDVCTQLTQSTPEAIPLLLPQILNKIRMIWTASRFYNTDERLTGLLRKVS